MMDDMSIILIVVDVVGMVIKTMREITYVLQWFFSAQHVITIVTGLAVDDGRNMPSVLAL